MQQKTQTTATKQTKPHFVPFLIFGEHERQAVFQSVKVQVSKRGDWLGNVEPAVSTWGPTFPRGLPAPWWQGFLCQPWFLLPPPGLLAAAGRVLARATAIIWHPSFYEIEFLLINVKRGRMLFGTMSWARDRFVTAAYPVTSSASDKYHVSWACLSLLTLKKQKRTPILSDLGTVACHSGWVRDDERVPVVSSAAVPSGNMHRGRGRMPWEGPFVKCGCSAWLGNFAVKSLSLLFHKSL